MPKKSKDLLDLFVETFVPMPYLKFETVSGKFEMLLLSLIESIELDPDGSINIRMPDRILRLDPAAASRFEEAFEKMVEAARARQAQAQMQAMIAGNNLIHP